MARYFNEKRKESTIIRDNNIHQLYNDLMKELGMYGNLVPKSYIYKHIQEKTGLCEKTVAYILNHTRCANIKNP